MWTVFTNLTLCARISQYATESADLRGLLGLQFAASYQSYCQKTLWELFPLGIHRLSLQPLMKIQSTDWSMRRKTKATLSSASTAAWTLKKKNHTIFNFKISLMHYSLFAVMAYWSMVVIWLCNSTVHCGVNSLDNHNPCSLSQCLTYFLRWEISSDPWRFLSCKYLWCR